MKLNTYLNFPGNCAEAMSFYAQHLGAKIVYSTTFDQMPDPKNIPPGLEKGILHASFTIGDGVLMASDGPPDHVQPMRSAYLCLGVDSTEEAERIYAALTPGGEIFMSLAETFFAYRFAQFRDKFGINWMLIHDKPMH
ncbi:MAG TPA: VOC family protein [Terracidiphilus sp.]|jgi:PhnB protein|nr:VOC family protein [Terracidiphilus sp.]